MSTDPSVTTIECDMSDVGRVPDEMVAMNGEGPRTISGHLPSGAEDLLRGMTTRMMTLCIRSIGMADAVVEATMSVREV